jgi:hypothetical protein
MSTQNPYNGFCAFPVKDCHFSPPNKAKSYFSTHVTFSICQCFFITIVERKQEELYPFEKGSAVCESIYYYKIILVLAILLSHIGTVNNDVYLPLKYTMSYTNQSIL